MTPTRQVSPNQVLEELCNLEPSRWPEVVEFIRYLKSATGRAQLRRELTARDLLQSDLVGMWADRDDIGDSLTFARHLRQQSGHR